jgi:hypothetical protein
MPTRPLLDFGAGYVKRVIDQLPRQGFDAPWYMSMDYNVDLKNLREGPITDSNLVFDKQQIQPKPEIENSAPSMTPMRKAS